MTKEEILETILSEVRNGILKTDNLFVEVCVGQN